MAGHKRKGETISSVSDILGFVLEQSELPPEKRKPVRPPQTAKTQASSDYAQTLVDALALPGTFVGDEYLKTMGDLVDPELSIATQSAYAPGPAVKIKLSDLPDFFKNPDDFINKTFKKNKELRKRSKLTWAGEQMRMLAGSTYAKKMGLFEEYGDLKPLLERAVGQVAMDSKNVKDAQWIAEASAELRKKGFASQVNISRLKREFSTLEGLLEMSGRKPGQIANDRKRKQRLEGQINALSRESSIDARSLRSLLGLEFDERERDLLGGRKEADLTAMEYQKLKKLRNANSMVDLWSKPADYIRVWKGDDQKREIRSIKEARDGIRKNKESFKDQLRAIEKGEMFDFGNGKKINYRGFSKSAKKDEILHIKDNLKQLNSAERELTSIRFFGGIGELEGKLVAIKQTLGPGGLEAMLNGTFYDEKRGYFGCPSRKIEISFGKNKEENKWNTIKFVKSNSAGKTKDRHLSDAYNDTMVHLYYLNPTTWMKSLVNGEGFAWVADKEKMKLGNDLKKMWGVKSGVFKELQNPDFWLFYKKYKNLNLAEQAKLLTENPNYKNVLGHVLKGLENKNSAIAKKFLKAEEMAKVLEKWNGVAHFFSRPTRALNWLNEKTIKKLQQHIRNGLFKVMSKFGVFVKDEAAMALLKSWKATGGAALSAAISKAILTAIGASVGAIAGPLGSAVTIAVSFVLDEVIKVSIKVIIYAFVGVIGLLFLIITPLTEFTNRAKVDSYSREIPGTVFKNKDFMGYGGSGSDWSDPNDGSYVSPIDVPAPINSSCPFGDVGYACSQGFVFTDCHLKDGRYEKCSHNNIKNKYPVDLTGVTHFYAPQYCDTSNCTAKLSSMTAWRCGRDPDPSKNGFTGWNIEFSDGQGNVFNIMHAKLSPPRNGRSYTAGEPVAEIYQLAADIVADDPLGTTVPNENGVFNCWTGPHVHLTITHGGTYVDPIQFLANMGCGNGVQSVSQCRTCCYYYE